MKFLMSVVLLLIMHNGLFAQYNLDKSINFINKKEQEFDDLSEDTIIVSYEALNVFFARQVNTYLSSSTDLSLNKSYFVLDQPDKRIFLGYNVSRDPVKSLKRTWNILTLGLNASYGDNFSNLYSARELSNDIGIGARFTLLGKGVVSFDKTRQWNKTLFGKETEDKYQHRERIEFQREKAKIDLVTKKKNEATEFEKSIQNITDKEYQEELRKDFYKTANETLVSDYLNLESGLLEKPRSHHWFWTWWVTADFYLPVTKIEYAVAETVINPIDTVSLKNTKISIIANMLADNRWGRLLLSGSYGWRNNNGITTDQFKKLSYFQYRNLGGTDTLRVAQLTNQEVYVGQNYETFVSTFVRGQIVFFPKIRQKTVFGFSIMAEKYYGKYNPFNLRVGIPFSLKGKEDGKPVNFEVQGKWDDYFGDINKSSPKEKFVIGISVGLTLTSKVY